MDGREEALRQLFGESSGDLTLLVPEDVDDFSSFIFQSIPPLVKDDKVFLQSFGKGLLLGEGIAWMNERLSQLTLER